MDDLSRTLVFFLTLSLSLNLILAVDFIFNGFDSSSSSGISLFGNATIESRVLTLTNKTNFSIGRALYKDKLRTKDPETSSVLSFYTSFIFSMGPYKDALPGHGIVFLLVPFTGINGSSSAQHLGLFNRTNDGNPNNHIVGIEFDVFSNQEFNDIDDNHVGVDINSLTSLDSHTAGLWPDDGKSFKKMKLNNGRNYQVWVDYRDSLLNVTMAIAGTRRPERPLLSVFHNLSVVLEDQMYVGFTASTGQLMQGHRILAWSFSNDNSSISESLSATGLPSFLLPEEESFLRSKWFLSMIISMASVAAVALLSFVLWRRRRGKARRIAEIEDWETEYWPHRIEYEEIEAGTNRFCEKNVIGIGGNGKVYKGVLSGGVEVAVKRISQQNGDGTREFLAEISSLGRLKHRNLVSLRGWCKRERGSLMLVYDYMENGSLDRRIFDCGGDRNEVLSYKERLRILKGVAEGVSYLHEGWEARVLHRDIKASNVLLDRDMTPRLGDFGLARVYGHGQAARTTQVVGTAGYLAPEVVRTGRASTQTDVFAFGVLVLEVMCGRRPTEEGKVPLVEWVRERMERGEISRALDPRRAEASEAIDEAERAVRVGLLCVDPDPRKRPSIRQVVQAMEGDQIDIYTITESEGIEDRLLNKKGSQNSHPTMEHIGQPHCSSSLSLSLSDSSWNSSILEGR